MKILSPLQIKEADVYTIANEPISSIDLMERASEGFTNWFTSIYPNDETVIVFAGMGNNGGDAMAIARMLKGYKYTVIVYIVRYSDKQSEDCVINEKRLKEIDEVEIHELTEDNWKELLELQDNAILIDGLWGSGLSRPIEGFTADLIAKINRRIKAKKDLEVVAIDIPSGLYAEQAQEGRVFRANRTYSFELPKLNFLLEENFQFTGYWDLGSIGLMQEFIDKQDTNYFYITAKDVDEMIVSRGKFDHKGNYGHSLLLCGCAGKMGAAVLAADACIRTGSGLTTVHVPAHGNVIMQTTLPEAMTSIDSNETYISELPDIGSYTAIGIGPGIGTEAKTLEAFTALIERSDTPLVVDADGLNLLAHNKKLLDQLPKDSILTPHPGEFKRLAGEFSDDHARLDGLRKMAATLGTYIVLKGAHTAVACPDGETWFNSTGNPGMASGGSGDVLCGMLTSLLAQGYSSKEACIIGVFLHGLAADIAACFTSMEALKAGDIIDNIGAAFIQVGDYEV
ncbi:MAG: NAD(P)H-hydrate dehydratase [Bacteroidetes bacterium]|nr:NAD(P)H-hydrate dehydratase [Bacteroidota bacterium]